jgi:hypothetical protein
MLCDDCIVGICAAVLNPKSPKNSVRLEAAGFVGNCLTGCNCVAAGAKAGPKKQEVASGGSMESDQQPVNFRTIARPVRGPGL